MVSRFKIFSDPVHGFISVPKNLILTLIQRPEVQRLRRIRQLGLGHLVFPGAEHTRFGHALGAMALMQDALGSLTEKGTRVDAEEQTAALAAALLHDVGHGPFSHTLEEHLIREFHHEDMSRVLLLHLNEELGGALDLAIRIFDDEYPRPFFHQLVSSQLDMDRLDYLRRDSAFTGVDEGTVGVQRIIKTMRVHPLEGRADSRIVVESKGIYAVENFIIARRLMYWQVYLHKTVLAGDHLLRAVFRRARRSLERGVHGIASIASPPLLFFLQNDIDGSRISEPEVYETFCELDDTDVIYTLKRWSRGPDPVLADLARRFIDRDFFRVTFLPEPPTDEQVAVWREQVANWLVREDVVPAATAEEAATYYVTVDRSRHTAYERFEDSICVLERDGTLRELSERADTAAVAELSDFVVKPYVCYPKPVGIDVDAVPEG